MERILNMDALSDLDLADFLAKKEKAKKELLSLKDTPTSKGFDFKDLCFNPAPEIKEKTSDADDYEDSEIEDLEIARR